MSSRRHKSQPPPDKDFPVAPGGPARSSSNALLHEQFLQVRAKSLARVFVLETVGDRCF